MATIMRGSRMHKVYRIRAAHYPTWFMAALMIFVCGAMYAVAAWATSILIR